MKKRKLLETLKELIETNAQLSAQNEELLARVGKEEQHPAEVPFTESALKPEKDFEKLKSDNRILSQELIEAKATILELTKQLEAASSPQAEEPAANNQTEQTTEESVTVFPIDSTDKAVDTKQDNEIDLFIGLSLNITDEPTTTEINEVDYIVKPIFDENSTASSVDDIANPVDDSDNPIDDTKLPTDKISADITDWQIDMASKYIGKAIIMITEFNNDISDSTSENKQDLITLALGKSEGFKAEIVDAISACGTPEIAETTAEKRIDELRRYINALRLSV